LVVVILVGAFDAAGEGVFVDFRNSVDVGDICWEIELSVQAAKIMASKHNRINKIWRK
jgi:hypothetical protein